MPRQRKTDAFLGTLLDALHPHLPGDDWQSERAPHWRLVRRHPWGYVGVGPQMGFKHLPATRVYLSYGIKHDALEGTLRKLYEAEEFEHFETYQVSQTTDNHPLLAGASSVSVDDYNHADADALIQSLLGDSGVDTLLDIFARFADLREVRRSLEESDGALMTYGLPELMVAIDLALDDLDHLREFRDTCTLPHYAKMIDEDLGALGLKV